jgi:hypothetical protein
MNSLENFSAMMNQGRGAPPPQWMPLDITVTPPIADLTEARLGTRDRV